MASMRKRPKSSSKLTVAPSVLNQSEFETTATGSRLRRQKTFSAVWEDHGSAIEGNQRTVRECSMERKGRDGSVPWLSEGSRIGLSQRKTRKDSGCAIASRLSKIARNSSV